MNGGQLPLLRTPIPGPASRSRVDVLARHESPAITARRARRAMALGAADDDPIVWAEAVGANVEDVDGNRFVDLTSGFGVAFVGHRNPAVVAAAKAQSDRLLHAMGDAWPDTVRIELLERLAGVTPEGVDVAILGLSGSDAVEAAVKTGIVATGKTGIIAFEGAYHGLTLGAVPLQGYNPRFTEPFREVVSPERVRRLAWGCPMAAVEAALADGRVGLVIAEPLLGRGGMRPAPSGWHAELAATARAHGALYALDEVQTGIGRTGTWFACEAEHVVPDLLCVGKALGGGFPLSACIGSRAVMDRWGASEGEALHTQTFLGHPVGCAAALAVLDLIERDGLVAKAGALGDHIAGRLRDQGWRVHGRGLMIGVDLGRNALAISRSLQRMGYLALPAGPGADILGLTPPVCLTEEQIEGFVAALSATMEEPEP